MLAEKSFSAANDETLTAADLLDLLIQKVNFFYQVHFLGYANAEPFVSILFSPGFQPSIPGPYHIDFHTGARLGAFLHCTPGTSTVDVVSRHITHNYGSVYFLKDDCGEILSKEIESGTASGNEKARKMVKAYEPVLVQPYYRPSLLKKYEENSNENRHIAEVGDLTLLQLNLVHRTPAMDPVEDPIGSTNYIPKPRCILFLGISRDGTPFEPDFGITPSYILRIIHMHKMYTIKDRNAKIAQRKLDIMEETGEFLFGEGWGKLNQLERKKKENL